MPLTPEQLAARYGHLATVVVRGGRTYPAAFAPLPTLHPVRAVVRTGSGLRRAAAPWLQRRLAEHPWLHDGPTMAFGGLSGDELRLGPGRYFDRLAIGEAIRDDDAVRDFADRAAGGDPLRSGRLRGAAPGVTVFATFPSGAGRAFVIGRRRGLPVADGTWHVVPAGTMDRTPPGVDPIRHTALNELSEELGLAGWFGGSASSVLDPNHGLEPAVLGVGWDLERLLPEVVLRLDLDVPLDEVLAAAPRAEHDELRGVPLADTQSVWRELSPQQLSPPGAAALALLEESRRP